MNINENNMNDLISNKKPVITENNLNFLSKFIFTKII